VSHTVILPDKVERKTLGLIPPRARIISIPAAARAAMEIVAGDCTVVESITPPGRTATVAGTHFDRTGETAGFTIAVSSGLCEYICSFLA